MNKGIIRLLAGVLAIVLLLFLMACAESGTPAPIATPVPTVPTTAGWSADGVITPGEYSHHVAYDDGAFEINWKADAQCIYIGIKAKTSGWVSLGFNATSRLKNVDYFFGGVSNGKTYVSDEFSEDFHGQHVTDESLGGKGNFVVYGGQEQDGYTIIEFQRALVTGDSYDASLASGDIPIVWAYSSSDDISVVHSRHGSGNIQV